VFLKAIEFRRQLEHSIILVNSTGDAGALRVVKIGPAVSTKWNTGPEC
jgi:hypothetical protein